MATVTLTRNDVFGTFAGIPYLMHAQYYRQHRTLPWIGNKTRKRLSAGPAQRSCSLVAGELGPVHTGTLPEYLDANSGREA